MNTTPQQQPAPRRRGLLGRLFVRGSVVEVEQVAASTRRVRLGGAAMRDLDWRPGQHVRLHVQDFFSLQGLLKARDTLRTYSVWHYDPLAGQVDLCVHDHGGDGPGVRWARSAEPGQPVTFSGPEGDLLLRDAPYHLFAGDESAAVPFGAMTRALGPDARVHGVLESESPEHDLDLGGPHGLLRVHRGNTSGHASPVLLTAVAGLDLPAEPGAAYLAGDARTCQALRDHLVRDRGWPRTAVRTKPFWAPGKRGLE